MLFSDRVQMKEYGCDGFACEMSPTFFAVGRGEDSLCIGGEDTPLEVTVDDETHVTVHSPLYRMEIYYSMHDDTGFVSLLDSHNRLLGKMRYVSETGIAFMIKVLQGEGDMYEINSSDSE